MRYIFLILFISAASICSAQSASIQWVSFTEAMELSKTKPKKIFIDMYTDWCGWCKKMDVSTFSHPAVAKYINEHYYAVKFNAEKEGPISVKDSTYALNAAYGRNGAHELAVKLMKGRLSYPTIVFLDEKFNLLTPVPGYQKPDQIEPMLKYFGEQHYLTQSWTDFSNVFKGVWN